MTVIGYFFKFQNSNFWSYCSISILIAFFIRKDKKYDKALEKCCNDFKRACSDSLSSTLVCFNTHELVKNIIRIPSSTRFFHFIYSLKSIEVFFKDLNCYFEMKPETTNFDGTKLFHFSDWSTT